MVEPLRHRQTKEAATDMCSLQPPRHISTPLALLSGIGMNCLSKWDPKARRNNFSRRQSSHGSRPVHGHTLIRHPTRDNLNHSACMACERLNRNSQSRRKGGTIVTSLLGWENSVRFALVLATHRVVWAAALAPIPDPNAEDSARCMTCVCSGVGCILP